MVDNMPLFVVRVQITEFKLSVEFTQHGNRTSKRAAKREFNDFHVTPSQGVIGYVDIEMQVPAGTQIIDATFNTHSSLHLNVATATGEGYAWVSPHH